MSEMPWKAYAKQNSNQPIAGSSNTYIYIYIWIYIYIYNILCIYTHIINVITLGIAVARFVVIMINMIATAFDT